MKSNRSNSSTTVDNIANGLYKAFLAYKNKYDKKIVVPYKKDKAEENTRSECFPARIYTNKE